MALLEKSAGAAGCSHCHRLGARGICDRCQRPICVACREGGVCDQPRARKLRLGLGNRLRAVDIEGGRGIVSSFSGRHRWVVDLHRDLVVAEIPMRTVAGRGLGSRPGFGPQGRLVFADIDRGTAVEQLTQDSPGRPYVVLGRALPTGTVLVDSDHVLLPIPAAILRDLVISASGDHAVVVCQDPRESHHVGVVDLVQSRVIATTEEADRISAVAVSEAMGIYVVAFRRELRIYRLRNGSYLATADVDHEPCVWVGLAGGKLATVGARGGFSVRAPGSGMAPSQWPVVLVGRVRLASPFSLSVGIARRRPCAAALSPDGKRFAIRVGRRRLAVYDLEGGGRQMLKGHTDWVHLIRFVEQGRTLLSADLDNRVVFWPATDEGDFAPLP